MTWENKAVVVTGGAMGIGRYIALGAAERGANVAIADIDEEGLDAVRSELLAHGHSALALQVDVSNEDDVRALMEQTHDAFGAIDYLVNNAAIVPHFAWGGPRWPRVRDMDFSFWSKIVGANLHGTWLCSKYAIPYMEQQGQGHIVNVYGGAPSTPAGSMAYVVTKEAGRVFTRFLAEEVRENNICVMSIRPGNIIATERAPEEARARMPGPESSGERYFLAAEADMTLSGHVVNLVDGQLVIND